MVYEVKKVKGLYNPAEKEFEGEVSPIGDPDSHLVSYEIKLPKGAPKTEGVTGARISNQFGDLWLDIKKADRLLVPSLKSLEGPIAEVPATFPIDHFICYQVKLTKDVEGNQIPEGLQVIVVDQFNQPALYDVKKVKRLCNPVKKEIDIDGFTDITEIIDIEGHLVCYDIKLPKGDPKHEKVFGIHVNNQFGPLEVETKKVKELCVPSKKFLTPDF